MFSWRKIIVPYLRIEKHVYMLILAQFSVQLIHAAFNILRNFFMLQKGYPDFEIAGFAAYNSIAITLVAFPLGLLIKGRKLKPLLTIATLALPVLAISEIYAIDHHLDDLLRIIMLCWGFVHACLSATLTPYLLLNSNESTQSEVISLNFQTGTIAMIVVGSSHFILSHSLPHIFTDRNFLYGTSLLGFSCLFFLFGLKKNEITSEKIPISKAFSTYDWNKIFAALTPTLLIAIGAGLTIQFINLFFESVHHVKSGTFAMLGASTYILVALGNFVIPYVRRKWGYHIAITGVQVLAILMLVGMASTEWYSDMWFALPLAFLFFIIRQPLMNVAGPATSELTMNYVGEKNRELVSSLQASIWSGSWFFSAKIFQILRAADFNYSYILLITALMYSIGVYAYHRLIQSYALNVSDS